jgi:integrating conjugative element protein (TIGR03761 family)
MNTHVDLPGEQPIDQPDKTGPGALRGEVWLNVQTYQAQSLIKGRRGGEGKPAIIGLVGFAERLKVLWQAVRSDDPYADWWLVKVEDSIGDVRSQLHRLQEQLQAVLVNVECFEVTFAQSSRPQRVSLQFANPYAFRAAQMLADYDRMVCTWMTARHLGLALPTEVAEQANGSGRWLRRVFALPQSYQYLEISRSDIHQGTARAEKARECMGDLPQEILDGEKLPSLRPVTFQRASTTSAPVRQDG